MEQCSLSTIGEAMVARFLSEHQPVCCCLYPFRRLRHELRAALAQLLEVLRAEGMGAQDPASDTAIAQELARSSVTQRLKLAVATAAERHPQLAQRSISPHTVRHTTTMHLLQSGVDITVIALWMSHESPATTHMYLQADLSMKERTLDRLQPIGARPGRYRPPEQLMQFLQSL